MTLMRCCCGSVSAHGEATRGWLARPAAVPTYTWTLTVPPDYPPPLPPLSGSGASASVEAKVPGSYSCTFTATAERECPPSPITIGPATKNTCQSGSAVAGAGPTCRVTITLKEITFSDDHGMYEEASPCELTNPDRCWGAGLPLSGVDWASVNNPDHPICYTRSTGMRPTVRMDVTGSGGGDATLRVVGPDGVSGQGTFSVLCGTEERFVSFTTSPLPSVVKSYTPAGLSWSVQAPGATAFTPIRATSHRIYVTFGTPTGSEPTNRRLNFVCNAAWNAGTAMQVIDGVDPLGGIGIHLTLANDPPNEPPPPALITDLERALHEVRDWRLMSGSPYWGECDEQANFMNMCLLSLGAPGGTVQFINASSDTNPLGPRETMSAADLGIIEDLDSDGTTGDEMLELIFDFTPPTGFWNWFEASLETPSGFYAVWPNYKAPSACELLLALLAEEPDGEGATQHWVFIRPNGTLYVFPATVAGPISCP